MRRYLWILLTVHTFTLSYQIHRCNRADRSNNEIFPIKKNDDKVIRVLSYNIRKDTDLDRTYGNGWDLRKHKITYLIEQYRPDLIGLQEVSKSYMADIKRLFPEYSCITYDVSDKEKDVALLIRHNRFIIKDHSFFWLSEQPLHKEIPLKPSWGSKRPRIVIKALVYDRHTEKKFIACSTHFSSTGLESGPKSAQVILQQLSKVKRNLPIILTGDFNFLVSTPEITKKSQEAYEYLAKNNIHLFDVRNITKKHYGPDGTWIGWPYDKYAVPKGSIGERLDHIFVRHVNALNEGVLNLKVKDYCLLTPLADSFVGIPYPSDHLPVIVDLIIK